MIYNSVLVTGGAGFIGSHTATQLLKQGVKKVVVVDELNDYYDPALKFQNVALLRKTVAKHDATFVFYKLDICQDGGEALEEILVREKIDAVVHLAARAGVRASIQQPHIYIHSNVLASQIIFSLATKHSLKCIYASSSSVYGSNKKVPFSEDDMTENVVSPYAASKKAVEAMAAAYSAMAKQQIIGLRFFTVYGPRGRPDMAPFKFTQRILSGQEIDQYGDGSSSRDYTYIDDIVDGILRALSHSWPSTDSPDSTYHRVYNLGNSTPVTLSEFIATCERVCDKKAKIRILPMQKGDVEKTFADISHAKRDFGYDPKTSLEAGLGRLVEWMLEFEKNDAEMVLEELEEAEFMDCGDCYREIDSGLDSEEFLSSLSEDSN